MTIPITQNAHVLETFSMDRMVEGYSALFAGGTPRATVARTRERAVDEHESSIATGEEHAHAV